MTTIPNLIMRRPWSVGGMDSRIYRCFLNYYIWDSTIREPQPEEQFRDKERDI